jgi:branched-chain amino acid aminotransferase
VSRVVYIDGARFAPEDAKVSVYDRGFLYGDTVFETIRTYGGRAFALDEHLARLERSAEKVAIPFPVTREALASEIAAAIAAAGNAESYARVVLSRGEGPLGLDPSLATRPLRVILVEPLVPLSDELYRDGVAVTTIRTERGGDGAHGAKVGNYLASLLALRQARAAGAHEAIVLDAAGRVVEGTTSNVFLVTGDVLVTPPEAAGILAGITREIVLELAPGVGLEPREASFTPAELSVADEAFLSSSLREILAIVSVDGNVLGAGAPGPKTRALHAAFRARVGAAPRSA